MKRVLFIGRWVIFHSGHKYLIDSYLNSGKKVCIAIRNTHEKYSAEQRKEMIRAVYTNVELVKIIIIPNISQVITGRGVGYGIAKAPREIENISGTKIREGKQWDIPKEVKELIKQWEK